MKKYSEAVLLAREQTKQRVISELSVLARAPIFQMVIGVAAVEIAQMIRPDGDHQLISDHWGTVIEGTITGGAILKSLGEVVNVSDLVKVLAK